MKTLKIRTLIGAFYWYLKRFFGSWNCTETFEIKDANWCILMLLIRCFRKIGWELLRNFLKRGCLMVHSVQIWNDVLEVGTAQIFLKRCRLIVQSSAIWNDVLELLKINRLSNGAFCLNLKWFKMRRRFIIIKLFVSYTISNDIP